MLERLRTPIVVITAGCLIAMFGFGARSVGGLFLEPMSVAATFIHWPIDERPLLRTPATLHSVPRQA